MQISFADLVVVGWTAGRLLLRLVVAHRHAEAVSGFLLSMAVSAWCSFEACYARGQGSRGEEQRERKAAMRGGALR